MCGIFFSLSNRNCVFPEDDTRCIIKDRGPDSYNTHCTSLETGNTCPDEHHETTGFKKYLTFISSVLSLRGEHLEAQPSVDAASGSVLCWNGEAWKISDEVVSGNDTHRIFELFLESTKPPDGQSCPNTRDSSLTVLMSAISSISGPYAFVFYDACGSRIIYGRDFLGRRSLLSGWDNEGSFKISSVCDGTSSTHFEEVNTDGIHVIDLTCGSRDDALPFRVETIPWTHGSTSLKTSINTPIPPMNQDLPAADHFHSLLSSSAPVLELETFLRQSLKLRIQNIPYPASFPPAAKVAVLFSGGLDCTILARLAHDLLPKEEPIDLLNVAFENPRVVAAAKFTQVPGSKSIYEECPDRQTGRSSYSELCQVCSERHWRFVCINIPYEQTTQHREKIRRLMRPHNTEMDLSIACALYFASRGIGEITEVNASETVSVPYTTTARVLLSGLGADEVFAGYQRHALAFTRQGFKGLIDETALDVGRLGKRNLGRDDRVLSNWGREARYPYLDEEFLAWALTRPVWEKCGFGTTSVESTPRNDGVDKGTQSTEPDIEPGKKALRLVAWNLGMKNVAREKKRAIQFGSRTAKMESGRSKGTHVLS